MPQKKNTAENWNQEAEPIQAEIFKEQETLFLQTDEW